MFLLIDTHWASRNFGSASKLDLCPDTNSAVSAAEGGGNSGETPSSAIACLLTVENRGRFEGGLRVLRVVTGMVFSSSMRLGNVGNPGLQKSQHTA